jgi:hypothetical protein
VVFYVSDADWYISVVIHSLTCIDTTFSFHSILFCSGTVIHWWCVLLCYICYLLPFIVVSMLWFSCICCCFAFIRWYFDVDVFWLILLRWWLHYLLCCL